MKKVKRTNHHRPPIVIITDSYIFEKSLCTIIIFCHFKQVHLLDEKASTGCTTWISSVFHTGYYDTKFKYENIIYI